MNDWSGMSAFLLTLLYCIYYYKILLSVDINYKMAFTARDIQAWEYVPLGPFLGKSFGKNSGFFFSFGKI